MIGCGSQETVVGDEVRDIEGDGVGQSIDCGT